MKLNTKYTERLPTACGLVWDTSMYEGSGLILHDRSGNKVNGEIINAVWGVDSDGTYLFFDGYGDYVEFGQPEVTDLTGDITISCTHKTTDWIWTGTVFIGREDENVDERGYN